MSEGRPLWELSTTPGDVLYLCLEDTFYRIQDRLFRLTDEASERLHFAVASCKLTDGLVGQLEEYLKERPDTRLIVIDTLQKVRTASKDNAYANDYGDISLLKNFADRPLPGGSGRPSYPQAGGQRRIQPGIRDNGADRQCGCHLCSGKGTPGV